MGAMRPESGCVRRCLLATRLQIAHHSRLGSTYLPRVSQRTPRGSGPSLGSAGGSKLDIAIPFFALFDGVVGTDGEPEIGGPP